VVSNCHPPGTRMVKNGPSITAGPRARPLAEQRVHGHRRAAPAAIAQGPGPPGLCRGRCHFTTLAEPYVRERGEQHQLQGCPVAGSDLGRGILPLPATDPATIREVTDHLLELGARDLLAEGRRG
jgi:hypothetical protein